MLRKLRKRFGEGDLIYEAAAERWMEMRRRAGPTPGTAGELVGLCLKYVEERALDLLRKQGRLRQSVGAAGRGRGSAGGPRGGGDPGAAAGAGGVPGAAARAAAGVVASSTTKRASAIGRSPGSGCGGEDRGRAARGASEAEKAAAGEARRRAIEAARKAVSRERRAALEGLRLLVEAEAARADCLAA